MEWAVLELGRLRETRSGSRVSRSTETRISATNRRTNNNSTQRTNQRYGCFRIPTLTVGIDPQGVQSHNVPKDKGGVNSRVTCVHKRSSVWATTGTVSFCEQSFRALWCQRFVCLCSERARARARCESEGGREGGETRNATTVRKLSLLNKNTVSVMK